MCDMCWSAILTRFFDNAPVHWQKVTYNKVYNTSYLFTISVLRYKFIHYSCNCLIQEKIPFKIFCDANLSTIIIVLTSCHTIN